MYTIDPAMSFGEVILYYEKYLTETKAEGKKPVSFLHFITGLALFLLPQVFVIRRAVLAAYWYLFAAY